MPWRFISPETNTRPRPRSAERGAARRSLHWDGKAIDVCLAHDVTAVPRDAAREPKRGGPGYCRASDCVSGDAGRFRTS